MSSMSGKATEKKRANFVCKGDSSTTVVIVSSSRVFTCMSSVDFFGASFLVYGVFFSLFLWLRRQFRKERRGRVNENSAVVCRATVANEVCVFSWVAFPDIEDIYSAYQKKKKFLGPQYPLLDLV